MASTHLGTPEPVGLAVLVRGTVSVTDALGGRRLLSQGGFLFEDEIVQTAETGSASIELVNGGRLELAGSDAAKMEPEVYGRYDLLVDADRFSTSIPFLQKALLADYADAGPETSSGHDPGDPPPAPQRQETAASQGAQASGQPREIFVVVEADSRVSSDQYAVYFVKLVDAKGTPVAAPLGETVTIDLCYGPAGSSINTKVAIIGGNSQTSFTISPLDDAAVIGAAGFSIGITGVGQSKGLIPLLAPGPQDAIAPGEPAILSLSGAPSITEGENASYTVSVNQAPTQDLVLDVDYDRLDTATGEFRTTTVPIRILAGQTSVSFTVAAADDDYAEQREDFRVGISNPRGGGFAQIIIESGTMTTGVVLPSGREEEADPDEFAVRLIPTDDNGAELTGSRMDKGEDAYFMAILVANDGSRVAAPSGGSVEVMFSRGGAGDGQTVLLDQIFCADVQDDAPTGDRSFTVNLVADSALVSGFGQITVDSSPITTTIVGAEPLVETGPATFETIIVKLIGLDAKGCEIATAGTAISQYRVVLETPDGSRLDDAGSVDLDIILDSPGARGLELPALTGIRIGSVIDIENFDDVHGGSPGTLLLALKPGSAQVETGHQNLIVDTTPFFAIAIGESRATASGEEVDESPSAHPNPPDDAIPLLHSDTVVEEPSTVPMEGKNDPWMEGDEPPMGIGLSDIFDQTIDLSPLGGTGSATFDTIETLWLDNQASMTLSIGDLLDLTNGGNKLVIEGNGSNQVTLNGMSKADASSHEGYEIYLGTAPDSGAPVTLYLDAGIDSYVI